MFVNNINPDILNLGPFSVRFYGIVYALGFLLVAYLLSKEAEKKKIKNLDKEKAVDLTVWALVFGLIGARIFHVLSDFYLYKNNILGIFEIWKGGLGFYGGVAGGILAIYFYCRKHKVNLVHVLDIISLPFPLIIAFGRIANYLNSEHVGFASQLPWCVVFEKVDMICRHPAQIYESLSMFVLFTILMILHKKFSKKTGFAFWSFITGYGIMRFITDFFRQEQSFYISNLAHTQIISICMIIYGIYSLIRLYKVKK
jgi:phosphatidylglycerol---prolipoprotein diacylglyceryl transferase